MEPDEPDFTVEDDEDENEESPEPQSPRAIAAEILAGLFALTAIALGVLGFYIAGGVFLGIVETAAPVVIGMIAALLLARYLSRRSSK